MKRFFTLALLLASLALPVWAVDGDEIIIEMDGGPSVLRPEPTLWDYNAPQLTRRWRGKTREQVLYAMPVVSDKDRIVRAPKGEYALVEYYNGNQFRKFLFQAETPQRFIAAAATAADVLAINKKYGVNIGLSQQAFENFYAGKFSAETAAALTEKTVLYCLDYTDINTPKPQRRCFLFEKAALVQTFENTADKDAYLKQKRETAQRLAAPAVSLQQQAVQIQTIRTNTAPVKALLYGGTAYDQAYMPRVTSSAFLPKPTGQNSGRASTPN